MPRYQIDLSIYYLQNMLLEVEADTEDEANDTATALATTAAIDVMHGTDVPLHLDEITAWAVELMEE